MALSHDVVLAAALGGAAEGANARGDGAAGGNASEGAEEGGEQVRHGLSTYRYFADGASRFVSDAVVDDSSGAISVVACERLLRQASMSKRKLDAM